MDIKLLNQRYRLDRELGHGSMGVVYLGFDLLLERDILVKLLNPSGLDTEGRERLLREAQAAAKLDHPNIISVYDAGEAEGAPFVVMQAFVGQSLHQVGPLPIPQVLEIAIQVCRALEHAHSQGIIHRDVKPENVIVVRSGEGWLARLTDFGLARSRASRLTVEGTVVGTVYYMAPEQVLGQKIDARTDLYAFGVMLYELTAGRLPFEDDDPLTVLSQHLHAQPVPPSTYNDQISSHLETLILRLLSKRPDDRPVSAGEVHKSLVNILNPPVKKQDIPSLPRHNLPTALSSFIGREKESAEVVLLLRQSRLLTLSGVGGTGKTRLALHCAAQRLDEYEHGIWLVELARLTDPERILPAVAAVFGFYEGQEDMPLEKRLLHHLSDKHLLLILDNCEHLITATASLVDAILRAAPEVKVMATSREALGLEGEKIYLVPALSLPDSSSLPPLAELQQFDAVHLFVERASYAQPAFALTEVNAPEVVHICQRLDGIPLAIELAAARVKALSTQQILARLNDRFRLLTGGSRTALPRQKTLRATIDWSYGLLSPPEQALLRSLSVFMGGFTLEAAEAVCGCDELDVLDGLALLVNKSLIETEMEKGEVRRYRLLETVRQYAQEKLDECGDLSLIHNRHLTYFLDVSQKAEQSMRSFKGWDNVRALKIEATNFRVAFNWAFGMGDPCMVSQGLQMACNLKAYFQLNNLYREGLNWFKKGLALLDAKDERNIPVCAKAFYCAAELSNDLDNNLEASIFAKESVNLFQQCKDPELPYLGHAMLVYANRSFIHALMKYADYLAFLEPKQSEFVEEVEERSLEQETIAILEKSGERWDLYAMGRIQCERAIEKKDYSTALIHVDRFRTVCVGTEFEGTENVYLAQIARAQGDFSKSLFHYQKMIDILQKIGLKLGVSATFISMGDCSKELNQLDQALEYYHEALTNAREFGAKWQFTYSLRQMAEICLLRGQFKQVGEYLLQGLTLAPEMAPDILASNCLYPLLRAAEGISPQASQARLLGSIHQLMGNHPWSVKSKATLTRITTALQAHLTPDVFLACLEAGRKLTVEQVQAEAQTLAREVANYQPQEAQ